MGIKNISLKIILLIIGLAIIFQNTASANDWPMYQQNLQNTGFTTDTILSPLEIKWEKRFDFILSGPVVIDDVVYITSDGKIYALYAKDKGKEVVVYQESFKNSIFDTPLTDLAISNQTIYVNSDGIYGSQSLTAIDAVNGKLK